MPFSGRSGLWPEHLAKQTDLLAPIRLAIRLELTPDGNPPITYDIGTITRPIADLSPEEIGLTLEEGQQLLRPIQVQISGIPGP
jgi:hypothetical protein